MTSLAERSVVTALRARWLAWGLVSVTTLLMAGADALVIASGTDLDIGGEVFFWSFALVFAAVGGLIASRHPGNAIGWIFLGSAVAVGLGSFSGSYANYWLQSGAGPEVLARRQPGTATGPGSSSSWFRPPFCCCSSLTARCCPGAGDRSPGAQGWA